MATEKIIFILGADFSGTTMLDLMLGSHPDVASIGELSAFIEPTLQSHIAPTCSCHTDCGLWAVRTQFVGDPYRPLFDFHQVETLVDSSKHPDWVVRQVKRLRLLGKKSHCILIWKSPENYAKSCANRGNPDNWVQKWLRYNEAVMQSGLECYPVSFEGLQENPRGVLTDICNSLNIAFEDTMVDWSSQTHHVAFGSATARRALHSVGTDANKRETSASLRSDLHGSVPLQPRLPTYKEKKRIVNVCTRLSGGVVLTSFEVRVKTAFLLMRWRKKIERFLFFIGVNPVVVRSWFRGRR